MVEEREKRKEGIMEEGKDQERRTEKRKIFGRKDQKNGSGEKPGGRDPFFCIVIAFSIERNQV